MGYWHRRDLEMGWEREASASELAELPCAASVSLLEAGGASSQAVFGDAACAAFDRCCSCRRLG